MGHSLTIEGEIATREVHVQVRRYQAAEDADTTDTHPGYKLVRSLVAVPFSPNTGPSWFANMGDVFLTPARVPLRYRGNGNGTYRHVTCQFDTATVERLVGQPEEWEPATLQACLSIRRPEIDQSLLRLAREALAPGFASGLLVDGLAQALLADVTRHLRGVVQNARPVKGGLTPRQLHRIQEFAQASYSQPRSVADFAAVCGLSSGHLMRAFKQTTGQTIHSYVEELRLLHAQRLLSETDTPIKTIAADTGFRSPSSFSYAFRRATGANPAAFRREFRRVPERRRA